MRMRRAAFVMTLALVAACSSESSDDGLNPQPLPPEDKGEGVRGPNAGGGTSADGSEFANGTCRSDNRPTEGSACDANADSTCSWAVTCPTGLVLPYEVTCTDGVWKVTNGCPAEGETDARGCPARQPQNDAACDQTGANFQCGYVLECTGYRKSAIAQCAIRTSNSGPTWSTTPLGACD